MSQSFYITTPIYYVNDKPHIGHAYTTILADVLARYHRLLNEPTWFLTGTDEHGQKVAQAAEKKGMSCQQQADETVVNFQELWKVLNITNDDFIRTTEDRHKIVVQKILQDLWDRGEIYKDSYGGWYSVSEERYFTEKELVDGKDPISGRPVEWIEESNYFFKMSEYKDWLIRYINDNPEFIQPDFRRNETLGFLKQPLNDLCISRPKSRLSWGIELPFDQDYVTYVWFDALVNYISGVGYLADDETFKKWWPANFHLIGKDILTTHTVYWPTMLKAAGVPQPKTIFAHGWWLVDEEKMSKTTGNVINPLAFSKKYGVDAFRYYLISAMSLGQDANFNELAFAEKYNSDLASGVGNSLSRVLSMVSKNFSGILPVPGEYQDIDLELQQAAACIWDHYIVGMELFTPTNQVAPSVRHVYELKPDRAINEACCGFVRRINQYFDQNAPWLLAKEGNISRLATVLYSTAEALRVLSVLLYPTMPGKMDELRSCFGLPEGSACKDEVKQWGVLSPGQKLQDNVTLFPRIDLKALKAEIEAAKQPEPAKVDSKKKADSSKAENVVDLIEIGDVSKVSLKTAKVLEAVPVEGSDRLLRLQIDVGSDKRQIIAGVAKFYTPEEMVGKTIVVVSNLKPATIFGVESNGMLLAAKKGKKLKLITVDGEMAPGASVG